MATNQVPELHRGIVFVVLMMDEMLHTEANGYRCDDETCPCAADAAAAMEQESPDDMARSEAWLARQAAQHIEDKAYFSQWGLHEDQ